MNQVIQYLLGSYDKTQIQYLFDKNYMRIIPQAPRFVNPFSVELSMNLQK